MLRLKERNKDVAPKNKIKILKNILRFLILFCSIISLFFLNISYNKIKEYSSDTFKTVYADTNKNTFNKFRKKSYNYYEAKNHVSNRAKISIGNIKEENSLEVLSVSDYWMKVSDFDNDNDKTKRWVEFSATGIYTVDMSVSEFIIDDYNNFVIAKIETPKLTQFSVGSNPKVYLYEYKKGFCRYNGNYNNGTEMYIKDLREAYNELQKQLNDNHENLINAKNSAEKIIKTFIKNLNADINLTDDNIIVEFI